MKHHRLPVALPTLLAFLLLTGATARGQVEALDPHDASLHSQLQRLNDNIERIATLLEASTDSSSIC